MLSFQVYITMDHLLCALCFPHALLVCGKKVRYRKLELVAHNVDEINLYMFSRRVTCVTPRQSMGA